MIRVKYNSEKEREELILYYSNFHLVGEEKLLTGNYLIFSEKEIEIGESDVDKIFSKIKVLEEEIKMTQTAVDFILMSNESGAVLNKLNLGGNTMGAYFASRILKEALKYEDVIRKYPEFKDDIDFILRSEGREDLIVGVIY